jgi:hypothetical protein
MLKKLRGRKKFHTEQVFEHKLHIACGHDACRLDVVETLLDEHGANITRCLVFADDYEGLDGQSAKTPLFRACNCEENNLSIIRKLLDCGADIDFICPQGTALEVATNPFPNHGARVDVIRMLLNWGARCDLPGQDEFPSARPLDRICELGLSEPARQQHLLIDLAKAAIRNGADVNAQDQSGPTQGCR